MTIAALLALLDEIDQQGGPEAARQDRLHLDDHKEGLKPMAQPVPQFASTPVRPRIAADPQPVSVGILLKWGDDHPDPEVQDQAARARIALHGLRQRYAADQELSALASEEEQLAQRLEEIRARKGELTPAKPKKKRAAPVRDYEPRDVRAWAAANNVDCPRVGQIPKHVLDAWRAAQTQTG
ncbi:MAG: hypothetical protein HOV70_02040 [Streptomyces sp.]|nr:hypothetical protein [Streptomyces sp.]